MESQEQNIGKIKYVLNKLKYITLAVQVMPFIYTAIYIVSMVLYLFVAESVKFILDTLVYVSPLVICAFLVESWILKLCHWHKLACILPILPQVITFIDYYIIELTEVEFYISIATPTVLSILLLISAYKVFFSNGC